MFQSNDIDTVVENLLFSYTQNSIIDQQTQSIDLTNSTENETNALSNAVTSINSTSNSIYSGDDRVVKLRELKDLLNKCISRMNVKINEQEKQFCLQQISNENTIFTLPDAQFIEPRGRFKTSFTNSAFILEGKQFSLSIEWGNISHAAVVASSTTAKKEGEDLLAIKLTTPIKCNNKDIYNILMNLSRTEGKKLEVIVGDITVEGHESKCVVAIFENLWGRQLTRPKASFFCSSTGQKPYIRCYRGIQEGVLYPLQSGLLFVKPMLFISSEEMHSLAAGRGGTNGNTRYVDMIIETVDKKKFEFTNIEREELGGLQRFVNRRVESQKAVTEKNTEKGTNPINLDDNSDDSEDEDYDPEDSDSAFQSNESSDESDDSDSDNSSKSSISLSKKRKIISKPTSVDVENKENEIINIIETKKVKESSVDSSYADPIIL